MRYYIIFRDLSQIGLPLKEGGGRRVHSEWSLGFVRDLHEHEYLQWQTQQEHSLRSLAAMLEYETSAFRNILDEVDQWLKVMTMSVKWTV
jgi:hypothetical protein